MLPEFRKIPADFEEPSESWKMRLRNQTPFFSSLFVGRLIYVSIAYIPNLGPLGPLLHVEKFVVVVGGGGGCVKQF